MDLTKYDAALAVFGLDRRGIVVETPEQVEARKAIAAAQYASDTARNEVYYAQKDVDGASRRLQCAKEAARQRSARLWPRP